MRVEYESTKRGKWGWVLVALWVLWQVAGTAAFTIYAVTRLG